MKKRAILLSLCLLAPSAFSLADEKSDPATTLWYVSPAQRWQTEVLPIGNGSLGACFYAGVDADHIQFNEDSLWIGDEVKTGAYQPFGDIFVLFDEAADKVETPNKETIAPYAALEPSVVDYRLQLDIAGSVLSTRYKKDGVQYERTAFSSRPAQVMVMHYTADKKAAYNGAVVLTDMHKAVITASENRITAKGNLEGYNFRNDTDPYTLPALDYEAQLWVSMRAGGVKSTGWGVAARLNVWSRLHDADMAYQCLNFLLSHCVSQNLFDQHGPFQIDGNFGYVSGLCEMLVQSHLRDEKTGTYRIHLLPALPKAWPDGSIKGIKARGGFELDVAWKNGMLHRVVVRNLAGMTDCTLRYGNKETPLTLEEGKSVDLDGSLDVLSSAH